MGLWLALGLMTTVAVGLVVAPLLRRAGGAATRRDYDLQVYRAQLAELAREQERGLLGEREAAAARLEVERRILSADAADGKRQAARTAPLQWATLAVLLVGLPTLTAGLYALLGSPDQPAAPFAGRTEERERNGLPSPDAIIARLETRLKSNPDDLETTLRLGSAYALAGQFARATDLYRQAIGRRAEVAALHSALGEALVMASDGVVGPEARSAFEQALALDVGDVRARFYAGLGMLQRGEEQAALDAWVSLIEDTPGDAPWLPGLRQRAAALAAELGLNPDETLPAPALVAEDDADPEQLRRTAERLEAQLAAEPKDYQGWIRLARAWAQLDEPGRAQAALDRGADAYAGAPFVQQQLRIAAGELGLELSDGGSGPRGPTAEQMRAAEAMSAEEREQMIRGMVDGLAARLEQQPDDVEGWRMLGRSWAALGEPAKSAAAYAQVAQRLPDDLTAQLDYVVALLAQQSPDEPPSSEIVARLEQILERDGDNPIALFHLGRAAVARGDTAAAVQHWQRLLAQLPADAPVRPELERLLNDLRADG